MASWNEAIMYHDHSSSAISPDEDMMLDSFQPFPATVGQPIVFSFGQFTGSTIRMELNELQKADLGRKYARADRRPLDPPPVVQLTLFEVQNAGTEIEVETELDYENVQVSGLLCTVDLFPVPDCFAPFQARGPQTEDTRLNIGQKSILTPQTTSSADLYGDYQRASAQSVHNLHSNVSNDIFPSPGTTVIHHWGNYPITESIKLTQSLAGATFVQAVKLEYQGKLAILFAFSDIAVKTEGAFILRYRAFDLFSHLPSQKEGAVIGAETYGGAFRVYSTKDFPGLRPSTDLTKNLARWGVRLNIREMERKRKKEPDNSPLASPMDFTFAHQ